MAETEMMLPSGVLTLRRPHTAASSPLRAWSAADELLLAEFADVDPAAVGRVLVVNDEFGAISCGLAAAEPILWSDSVLSRAAIEANLDANGLPSAASRFVTGDRQPQGSFDTIVIRVPKTTALLDYQLSVVASVAAPDATIVGTGMARHIHRSTVTSFEQRIGPTTTTRAVRKARLVHSELGDTAVFGVDVALEPTYFDIPNGITVAELPGTFSAARLDAASALLLEHLGELDAPAADHEIVDLGCGNGVLAASLARRWPDCRYLLFDVSDLAVAAARATWQANGLTSHADFVVADGLSSVADDSVDLVITNPPFHQGHALDADMTNRLLADAARTLRAGEIAAVVAQRDLNLHSKMKQWFSTVEVVSKHPNYVVLFATA